MKVSKIPLALTGLWKLGNSNNLRGWFLAQGGLDVMSVFLYIKRLIP